MENSSNTKQLIREYIEQHTAYLGKEDELIENINKFSAIMISEKFNISRNLASHYLNEWNKDGILHKTLTRPVYFFSRKNPKENIEIKNKIQITTNAKDDTKKDIFTTVIGHDGSLYNVITQCKAAIKYPPDGLPMLFTGTSGSGKSYLANMVYNYAVEEGIIDSENQFVTVNCSEFANNPELLTANLFGYKKGAFTGADSDNMGLIQAANGGVLFLDEIHSFNASCQEKLFLFMDKGIYHLMGDNKNWKSSSARLIFATTKKPDEALLRTLLRRIPVIISVPALEDRPIDEKEQLIFSFINNESKQINKKLKTTKAYFQTLMNYKFIANVGELKGAIKTSCANAFLEQENEEDCIILKKYYLPHNIISYSSFFTYSDEEEEDNQLIDPSITKIEAGFEKIINLFDSILKEIQTYMIRKNDDVKFISNIKQILTVYYDYVMFENNKKYDLFESYEMSLEKIAEQICSRYKIQFQNNGLIPLLRYLIEIRSYKSQVHLYENENKSLIDNLYKALKNKYEYESYIANEFVEKCESYLDIKITNMNKIILLFNILIFNPEINPQRIIGIVLSHGYSTASSIADAVNKLLDDYVFEAIDMPLNVTPIEIGEKLQSLVRRRHLSQDIILLVDMGSLEEIYKEISIIPNLNIGIINNITTKMALEVGLKIQNNETMPDILENVSKDTVCHYKIIKNRKVEKAIIFLSEAGVEAARNMSELFLKSLPRSINVNIIPYDYYKLIQNGLNDEIFLKNEVIFIAGTLNPNIDQVPYIAIEEIISGNNFEKICGALNNVLEKDELKELQKGMLMNFSLINVVEYLTILNADKVLKLVNECLTKLQNTLGIELNYKSIIGLNVHLSCLVERLIKKMEIKMNFEVDKFINEHKKFIQACKESFKIIEIHYGIEFPISEIAYIYYFFEDYI